MATLTIQGQYPGTSSGTVYIGPFTLVLNSAGNYESLELVVTSGENTITIPTWATTIIIAPPPANAVALTLEGSAGDVGITISPSDPTLISLPSSPQANFNLEAASNVTNPVTVIFV